MARGRKAVADTLGEQIEKAQEKAGAKPIK